MNYDPLMYALYDMKGLSRFSRIMHTSSAFLAHDFPVYSLNMIESDVQLFFLSFIATTAQILILVKSFKSLCKLEEGEIPALECCNQLNFVCIDLR